MACYIPYMESSAVVELLCRVDSTRLDSTRLRQPLSEEISSTLKHFFAHFFLCNDAGFVIIECTSFNSTSMTYLNSSYIFFKEKKI